MSTLTRRPIAPAVSGDWRTRGACQTEDPELFFPVGFSKAADRQTEKAKKVCGRCPVMDECLEWALATAQDFGVLGGLSQRERWELRPTQKSMSVPDRVSPAQDRCWESVDQILAWRAQDVPGAEIAVRLGIGYDALYRWTKRYDAQQAASEETVSEEVAA